MTTVTAIIPVYNVKKYLARCLDSVLSQTIPFDRIVLVDDGSTDGCKEICDAYAEKNNQIQLIHKINGGLVSAWMEGVNQVRTSHICFIDSDDFIAPDYLECLLHALEEDIDLVSMQCMQYFDQERQREFKINALPAGVYAIDDTMKSILLCDHGAFFRPVAICRWGKIIRTDLVREYANYCTQKISYAEDQQLLVGVLYACKKIKILEVYKYYYQFNDTSILNSYKKDMWSQILQLMDTIRNIPDIMMVPNFERQFHTQFLLHVAELFRNEFYNHSLSKQMYMEIVNHPLLRNALEAYDFGKMRFADRKISQYAQKRSYLKTMMFLSLFKTYYMMKGVK